MKKWFILLTALLLGACSTLPSQLEPQTPETPVYTYLQWQPNATVKGMEVRAGGVIAGVTNMENQSRIEIINLPLSSTGRPDMSKTPQGRFVAYVDGFVDPMTYIKGKYITVVGISDGVERKKVGEYNYTFPVLKAHGQYLWTLEVHTYVEDWMQPCFYHGRYRPCRDYAPYPPMVREYSELN